jgi:nucleoside-triphosphatase THEP1
VTQPEAPGQERIEIEYVPWSELGPEFAMIWGRADPANPQPESMEVIGMNGSGKTLFVSKAVQERMIVRKTPCVIVATKPADDTILRLGWPIVDTPQKARKEQWCIYWPRTRKTGSARREFQRQRIQDLLDYLWVPGSNTIVVFDDLGYIQSLSAEIRDTIEMYLREGRSSGITNVLIKQRPQGAKREMHSETYWTVAFVPKDRADMERFAELFGEKKEWMAVFDSMDPDNHEFLIKHARSRAVYISWIDEPLRPIKRPDR